MPLPRLLPILVPPVSLASADLISKVSAAMWLRPLSFEAFYLAPVPYLYSHASTRWQKKEICRQREWYKERDINIPTYGHDRILATSAGAVTGKREEKLYLAAEQRHKGRRKKRQPGILHSPPSPFFIAIEAVSPLFILTPSPSFLPQLSSLILIKLDASYNSLLDFPLQLLKL